MLIELKGRMNSSKVRGPATEKAQSPNLVRVLGMNNSLWIDE